MVYLMTEFLGMTMPSWGFVATSKNNVLFETDNNALIIQVFCGVKAFKLV